MKLTEEEKTGIEGFLLLQNLVYKTSTDAGWYKNPLTGETITRNFGEVIALMHSELSEALEADRKSLMDDKLPHRDGRECEFADCVIRIMDTCKHLGLDLAGAIVEKNRFNKERADHRIENRIKPNGKKY